MKNGANEAHKQRMVAQKEKMDGQIADATEERGIVILLTGNGKGKSTSAFGMVMRSLGYGYGVAVVQFIKGKQHSGEEIYLKKNHPELPFYQMGTGFTWNTQDREADIIAAEKTWAMAAEHLTDDSRHLVILDELTYMIAFNYLDEEMILNAIRNRPANQTVVVTGRGASAGLRDLADTIAEIESEKHAFAAGIRARPGVDY
jgi:cob(I)alamin adenosyltransferase